MKRAPAFGLLLLVSAFACKKAPPPKPPTSVTAEVDAAPPPPKCETLSEACEAKAGTHAKVRPSNWTFEPPTGWVYAQEEHGAVANLGAAALAIDTFESGTAKQEAEKRDAALVALFSKIGATFPKKKPAWPKKPAKTMEVGTLSVSLFQFDGAARESKKGPVLVFAAKLPGDTFLMGAGFVADDDSTNADQAILKSIESLREVLPEKQESDAGTSDTIDAGAEKKGK